jgi:hypothetical protein
MLDAGARKRDPVAEYDDVGWSIGPMVGLSLLSGKAGFDLAFDLASGPRRPVSDRAWGGCTLSVHPVTPPKMPGSSQVSYNLAMKAKSGFRFGPGAYSLPYSPGAAGTAIKTASMTPESYCEAFGRPYVRP